MEKYIIDRIEGDIVVCEDESTGEMIEIEIYNLPEDVQEGDVLIYENEEYTIDYEERKLKEKDIESQMNELWED